MAEVSPVIKKNPAEVMSNSVIVENDKGEPELVPVVRSNYIPTQVDQYLEFIDFNSVGDLALGASSLASRYWTGQLWYHKAADLGDGEHVTDPQHSLTGLHLETGVMGGRFLTDQQLLLGLDSGSVVLVQLTKELDEDRLTYYLEQQEPLQEHDDILVCLDLWGEVGQDRSNQQHMAASVGADLRLNVYCPSMRLVQTYRPVHRGYVSGLSCSPCENNLLATCGGESVRVWDTRQARPALSLLQDEEQPPSSLVWDKGGGLVVVGSREGSVFSLDTRVPGVKNDSVTLFDREVRRFAWSRSGHCLAVAASDVGVEVVRVSEGCIVPGGYRASSSHTDYVRGLAWDCQDNLWSVGWDRRVVKHLISSG